jgi:hypothetical protein
MGPPTSSSSAPTELPSKRSQLRRSVAYGLPVLAFVAAGAAAYLISRDQEHSVWALGVAAFAAATTLLTAISQHLQERETSRLTDRLTNLAQENARLSGAIHDELIGGDSFAMAYFPKKNGQHWMALRHFGKQTLRDIRIVIQSFNPAPKHVANFAYPNLLPNSIETVRPFEFRDDKVAIQISFQAPNGWWAETVKAVRKDGELIFALRVWRPSTDGTLQFITLHEDVHSNYPRESNGQVDWSVGTVDVSELGFPSNDTPEDLTRRGLGML